MLSQSHDANYIRYWLISWFKDLKNPDEVIIDASEALISGSVQAFTLYASANKYVTACMKSLLENEAPPLCFIRLDRSHFVRSIIGNKLLRKLDASVSRLIKGVIGYLIQCDSIDTVKHVLQKVFTLTRNPKGTEDVRSAQSYLMKLVQTHTAFDDIPESQTEENAAQDQFEKDSESDSYRDTLAYKWLMAIIESVPITEESECDTSTLPNIYFSQKLNEFLLQLFVRIPMWSNIMCAVFGSSNINPSSSASESEFKNIKKLTGIKTKLVDVFVDLHLKHLSGKTKIELGEQKHRILREQSTGVTLQKLEASSIDGVPTIRRKRSSSLPKRRREIIEDNSLISFDRSKSVNAVSQSISGILASSNSDISIDKYKCDIPEENWRNKNTKSPTIRRSKASILNPHDVNYKYNNIPLLKNAYRSPHKIRKKYVEVCHTCAFDSVLCVYTAAFLDNRNLHCIIDSCNKEHRFSNFIKQILDGHQSNKQCYIDKTNLLYNMYSRFYKPSVVETENTISIDCETTLGPFLKKLLSEIDLSTLSSISETKTCPNCGCEYNEKSPLVNLQLVDKINLQRLSSYIVLENDKNWPCRMCDTRLQTVTNYAHIISFDVEPLKREFIHNIEICKVQQTLYIKGDIFKLFAVVEFKSAIKHFVAHVKRANDIWETYDDLKSDVIRSRKCTTTPMAIFAVFYQKQ